MAKSLNVKAWILILDYSMYMLVGHGHLFTNGPTLYMHLRILANETQQLHLFFVSLIKLCI